MTTKEQVKEARRRGNLYWRKAERAKAAWDTPGARVYREKAVDAYTAAAALITGWKASQVAL